MNAAEFLNELRRSSVRIWLEGEQLRCKAPKGVLTKDVAAKISARKPEIIAYLKSVNLESEDIPPPRRFDRAGDLPLSSAQERLWFLDQLEPDSSAYNLTASRRFYDVVDLDILQRSLDELSRRHEILRSTFPSRAGKPAQVVNDVEKVPLVVHDLRNRNEQEREQALSGIARDESHQLFDLGSGPLFRARLVLMADDECVLYVSLPHIIADGWSMGVLLEQLVMLYIAHSEGGEPPAEMPLQYGDFVLWQQSWLKEHRLESLLEYWKKQVQGAPLMLPYLAAKERAKSSEATGAVETFSLSADLSDAIKRLSRELQVTDFVMLFSIYSLVLARYSAVDKLLIGIPIANRNWVEFEKLIGLFVNTLALRADCDGGQTVADYLRHNHHTLLDAYSNQDLPFERLVEAVNPERVPGVPPIFQATFVFQNTPLSGEFTMISGGSMFDITCYIHDTPEGFTGAFEYNTGVLERSDVDQLIDSFQLMAAELVRDKQRHLRELPVVSESQRYALLGKWNTTDVEFDRDATVVSRFEAVAAAHPDSPALVSEERSLSYAELNESANRLCNFLLSRGVQPGDRVALCLSRSVELIVATLGALKAGAIYVPIDPHYPAERISMLVDDSGPRIVLTNEDLDAALAAPVADLRQLQDELDNLAGANPSVEFGANDAAYIIYTSGSTGTPKGVVVSHRNVLSLVDGADYIDFGPEQVFLLLAPAYFDASTFELWGGLLNGARCVVYPERVPNVTTLREYIERHGVTGLFLTTALFNAIIDTAPDALRSLKWLLFGGEAHSVDHVRRALKALPETAISQVYGPTECTTFATASRVSLGEEIERVIPIGGPTTYRKAFVLDEGGQLAPPGVPGELYLGGDGVASGYWKRPELTAERFVSLALSGPEPMRLYRTGDIVRWLPNGELEFIGRRDFQVKVRGFRVELGEIETALRRVEEVVDAVVLLREDNPGDKRLVAYVVAEERQHFQQSAVLEWLGSVLPEYMLPSAIVALDRLPLSSAGKVDRNALPRPSYGSEEQAEAVKQMPTSPLEVQIAALWEQALDRQNLGIDENFFDVGGNSLIAVRLFAQLEQVTGEKLPLATLFKAPTIRTLANVLSSEGREPKWDCLVGIQPLGNRLPLFLVPGVGGNVLSFAQLAKLLGTEQPIYGLQSRGLDGKRPPFTRAEEMAAHFVDEIRRVRPHGPYLLGGACMGGIVAYEMAQQLHKDGEEVAALMLIETASPVALRPGRRKLQNLFHPVIFLFEAALRHQRAMRGLSLREKWAYIKDKAGIVTEMIQHRDVYRGDRSVLYQDLVSNANYQVMANYVPTNYAGHLHLYLASARPIDPGRDTRMDWCELAEGGFSVNRVDATDSGRLFVEPWVSELAHQIQVTIEGIGTR